MRVKRAFAHCCAEAGGDVASCDCVNKNHGTAFFDVVTKPKSGADHARAYRKRRAAKLERYEAALREIVKLADTNTQSAFLAVAGNWARNALAPDREMGRGL